MLQPSIQKHTKGILLRPHPVFRDTMSSEKLIQTLKRDLKAKGISYKDVASYLKMTEAGVKKLFSKEDISFNKLKALCDLLQTSPHDLISAAENIDNDVHTFNDKQTKFFLAHKNYFHFFMKLAYEQKTPKHIQTEFALSTRSLNLYLKKLEELGLVKRHPQDRMQIMGGIPLAVKTKGTELDLEKYTLANEQLKILKDKKSDALRGAGLFLTTDEKNQFVAKIFEVILAASSTSRSNRKKLNSHAEEYTFMSFINEGSMFSRITEIQ